jgi:hypothetical protein
MKKVILSNAFSLQMLALEVEEELKITPISEELTKKIISGGFVSAIGHQDTANVLTNILGVQVDNNRVNVSLDADTVLIVAQVVGGRLPEGATELPEGFKIKFVKVQLI